MVRHNLVYNPSFEYDAITTNPPSRWTNFNTPTGVVREVQSDESRNRGKSWKCSISGDTADCGINNSAYPCLVEAGKDYTISCWGKTNLTVGTARLVVKVFKAGYAGEQNYQSNQLTGVRDWTRLSLTITVPTDYEIVEVWLCTGAYGTPFTGEIWFDDIMCEPSGNVGDYFDGESPFATWDGADELSTSTFSTSPVSGLDPAPYLLPNRKVQIEWGFGDEFISGFTGKSRFPEVDAKAMEASFHFFDELEFLSESKLSGGSLLVDIRTDRYIWGILDYVYQDFFSVVGSCDTDDSWTNTTDETDNQRGGDGCKKITSTDVEIKGYKTLSAVDWSTDYDNLDLFVYLSSLSDLDYCKLRLETTADSAYYEVDLASYGLVQGWNQLHLVKTDFTSTGSPSWSNLNRVTFVHKSVTSSTVYILVDEIRLTMAIGYPQRIFDTGIQNIPVAWWAGNTALYEIKTACEAEGARFYSGESGVLRFENRQHYALNAEFKESKWSFDFNNMTDLDYVGKVSDIINRVVVHLKPRTIVSEKEIWRYGFVSPIAAGATKTIWAEFTDPCPTDSTGIVTPVDTTDYTANTQADGGGTDKTAQISIAITKFATSAKIDVTNTDGSQVYLTLLKLRGTPAVESDESKVIIEDATSIETFGESPSGGFDIDNKYMADEAYAETVAQQIVDWYKSPVRRITLKNRSVPQLQIGDMISVRNNAVGETYLMRVTGIKVTMSNSDGFHQEISTRGITNFETVDYFTIGTSEIAGSDVIAP